MWITVTQIETEEDSCVNHRNAKCKCKEMHLNVNYRVRFAQLPVQTQRKHRREKWNDFQIPFHLHSR